MIKKNEEYIVDIIDNGFQGEGIAKIDNLPIFIEGAIKGEKIKVQILKVQKNFAYGKIINILVESEFRTESTCNTFSKCGGCSLRHIDYLYTLEIKRNIVQNCLNKMLNKKIIVNNVIGMKKPLYYRNKLQYPFGIDKEGKISMGVYSSRTHNIIPTKECKIQNELCQKIANYVLLFIKNNSVSIYNEKVGKGTIRHILVRIGFKTNEVLITLVLNDNNFTKYQEKFINEITSKFPEIKTIVKNFNTKQTNVILGKRCETIFGKGYIYDYLAEYKFKISALSFYQVNPIQTEVLYNTAIESIKNECFSKVALDLYCGIGTIGIFASKYFKKVYGIEIVEDAIKDARENAKINNINNMEFYTGDVETVLPNIIEKEKIDPAVVFVDPPRKGLDNKTINTLLELNPEKIIYISCNPATLARDLALFEEKYNIEKVQPVDMFPWTAHVECVAVMGKK